MEATPVSSKANFSPSLLLRRLFLTSYPPAIGTLSPDASDFYQQNRQLERANIGHSAIVLPMVYYTGTTFAPERRPLTLPARLQQCLDDFKRHLWPTAWVHTRGRRTFYGAVTNQCGKPFHSSRRTTMKKRRCPNNPVAIYTFGGTSRSERRQRGGV